MVTMVKTIARAHRDLCVLAVVSCYCVASCNRYLMLINHSTVGATRGLTLRVRLLGRLKKNGKKNKIMLSFFFIFFFLPKNLLSGLFAN